MLLRGGVIRAEALSLFSDDADIMSEIFSFASVNAFIVSGFGIQTVSGRLTSFMEIIIPGIVEVLCTFSALSLASGKS